MKLLILVLGFLFIFSCNKNKSADSPKYTFEEITKIAPELGLSKDKEYVDIKFSDYAAGVNRDESRALIYERLSFLAIEFESMEVAKEEAKRLNQYYARNWLFDRVEGEPILEDYLIAKFKAQNPNKLIQRAPKKEGEHGAEGVHQAKEH